MSPLIRQGFSLLLRIDTAFRCAVGRLQFSLYGGECGASIFEGPLKLRNEGKIKVGQVSFGRNIVIDVCKGGELVIGDNVSIGDGSFFNVGENARLTIGNNVFLGYDTVIQAYNSIEIGDDVLFARGCRVIDADHGIKRPSLIRTQAGITSPIKIGSDVWLGFGVLVLKGVSIGKGAVIGASSVITKEILPYCVAVGDHARVIKNR